MLDLLEYSTREHAEKLRLREEQAEERRLRLEEKKAILGRMEHPPVSPRRDKKKKRGKKQGKGRSAKDYELEFEATLATTLPSKSELLPYLPTPNEIIRETEGKTRLAQFLLRSIDRLKHVVSLARKCHVGKQEATLYSMREDGGQFARIQNPRWSVSRRSPLSTASTEGSWKRYLLDYS